MRSFKQKKSRPRWTVLYIFSISLKLSDFRSRTTTNCGLLLSSVRIISCAAYALPGLLKYTVEFLLRIRVEKGRWEDFCGTLFPPHAERRLLIGFLIIYVKPALPNPP